MRDIGVLKFIHQDVFVTLPQRRALRRVVFEQRHSVGDQSVDRHGIFLAQQVVAGLIRPRNLFLLGNFFEALAIGVFIEQCAFGFKFLRFAFRKVCVVRAADQFVLAAGKKLQKVVQKLSWLRQLAIFFQPQPPHVAPQQNPVIHFFQHLAVWRNFFQQSLAKRVERLDGHALAAFASAFHHTRTHLARGFVRKRQSQNIFAQQGIVRSQQMLDPLGNNARLPRPSPGNDQQRPVRMRDGAPLRFIQFQPAVRQRRHLK